MSMRTTRLALLLSLIPSSLIAAPPEVQDQLFYTIGQLSWSAAPGAAGYHVYRGDLSSLATGQYGTCLLGSLPGTTAAVPANPPVGQGYFYMVGAFDESEAGPVGFSSSGVESFPTIPCKPNRRNFVMISEPSLDGLGNVEPVRNASLQTESGPHGMTHVNLHSGEVAIEEPGYATAFFRSIGGLKTDTEVVDYQEGGVTAFTRKVIGSKFNGKYLVSSCTHKFYRSGLRYDGPLGQGWTYRANDRLVNAGPQVGWLDGQGRSFLMEPAAPGLWESAELFTRLFQERDGSFVLRFPDGYLRRYHGFDGSPLEGALTSDEDPDGSRMSYLYDHQGLLTTIVDQLGRSHTLEYDGNGRIVRETDFDGRETISSYDAEGNRVAVRSPLVTGTPNGNDFPAGKTTHYTYSSGFPFPRLNHNLLSIRTPGQGSAGDPVTRFDYGTDPALPSFDRVVSHVNGHPPSIPTVGGTLTYAYEHLNPGADPNDPDIGRRLTLVTDRNGNIEEREHNAAGHPLSVLQRTNRELRPGEPDYVTHHVYNANGQVLETTSPAGNRHVFVWDSLADLPHRDNLVQVRLVADPGRGDGHGGSAPDIEWSFSYEPVRNQIRTILDPRGHLVLIGHDYQEGDPATNGLFEMAARFQIDLTGVPLGVGDLNGDGRLDQIAGRPVHRQDPSVSLDTASQQAAIEGDTLQEVVTLYVYDDHGQLTSMVDPEGNEHLITYHPEADPDGDGTPTPPPADGRVLSTSGGGYPHTFIWDSRSEVWRNNWTNPPLVAAQIDLTYDARGNVTRLVDPRGVAFEWTYNQLDQAVEARRATATFPATGRGEAGLPTLGFRLRYQYDENDNLVLLQREDVGETRGAGPWVEQSFQYDLLDNLTRDARETTTGLDVEYRYTYDGNENPVTETTPEGVVHTMAWDERDLPLSSTAGWLGPRGGLPVARQYAYDGNGNLVSLVDGRGGLTDRLYDGFDRLVRAMDQVGNTSEIFHDPAGNVVRLLERGPVGGPTPPDRSGASNVDLQDTEYVYDELERVTRAYSRLFVPAGSVPVRPPVLLEGSLVPGDGGINRWIEYDKLSRMTFDHADAGTVSRFDYDGLGRRVKVTHPDGSTLDIAWDPAGNLIEEVETELPSTPGLPFERFFTTHMHDALGRAVLTFDGIGHGERRIYDSLDGIVATSDPKGPIQVTLPRRSALGAGLFVPVNGHGNVTRYAYDALDRLVSREQVLSAGGQGDGSLTPPPVPTPANPTGTILSSWTWGPDSLPATAHDGNGHTTSYSYDNLGRLAQEQADDETRAVYGYDGEGNLQHTIGADGTTVVQEHDAAQRRVGVSISMFNGEGTTQQTYEYDGLARLTRGTDNNQPADPNDDSMVSFLYDSLGRRMEETAVSGGGTPPATASMQWQAEDPIGLVYPSGRTIQYDYDGAGRLAFVVDPSPGGGSAALQYFGMSRVHTQALGNGARSTVLNDAGTADIGFDAARRMTLLRHLDPNNAVLAAYDYRYDRGSNRTSQRRPHHPGSGQSAMGELYLYDSADRLTGFQERMLTIDHLPAAPSVDGQTWALDATGNWASFTRRGVSYLNTPNNNNEYDDPQSGNARVDDGIPDDFADPAATSVPDGVNMAHDIKGNRTADGVRYVYDGLNRLIRTETMGGAPVATYSYDALGRRDGRYVLSSGIPVRFSRYWGGTEIAEMTGSGLPVHEVVHAPTHTTGSANGGVWKTTDGGHAAAGNGGVWKTFRGGGLAIGGGNGGIWKTSAAGVGYLLEDALGSTVGLVDGAAPVLQERVTYDPYGKPTFESPANVPLTDATGTPLAESPHGMLRLFGGMRYDHEAGSRSSIPAADRGGLYHTWHRSYSPNEGRFLTRDPLGAWGDPAAGGNAYAYAGGNPINAIDPTGLAMFNPKEYTIEKSTTWQKGMYNPKEVGLDKSVPWQKSSVYFNPREYTITKATPWKHHDIQGLDAPQVQRSKGSGDVEIKHDHVYQHNQTDLEFLRTRAARLGEGSWGKVYKSFSPRMSTADQVTKVIVRGWDPRTKQGIVGIFNWSMRNLPLIGSISVGFTIVPPAPAGSGANSHTACIQMKRAGY